MKKPLRKINIAGIWAIDVRVELHALGIADTSAYLMELNEAITKAAVTIANKQRHQVNLKSVSTYVHSGM